MEVHYPGGEREQRDGDRDEASEGLDQNLIPGEKLANVNAMDHNLTCLDHFVSKRDKMVFRITNTKIESELVVKAKQVSCYQKFFAGQALYPIINFPNTN